MGVGMLIQHPKNKEIEKRIMINVIGPHWDGNQVWLITSIGAIFAAWPIFYSILLSNFYLLVMISLIFLFLRPISLDFRSKIESKIWKKFFDFGIFFSSFFPTFSIGLIIGNIFNGVSFTIQENKFLHFGKFFQLFSIFSVLFGILFCCMFIFHASILLKIYTEKNIQNRMHKIVNFLFPIILVVFVAIGILLKENILGFSIYKILNKEFFIIEKGIWIKSLKNYKIFCIIPIFFILFLYFSYFFSKKNKNKVSFLFSCLAIFFLIFTISLILFPFIMPSKIYPNSSLTVWNATSSQKTLFNMMIISCILFPLVLLYTFWSYKKMFRKITKKYIKKNQNSLY
ncbi:hypothetical protein AOQ89_00280 [bacterium endosymbiont of Pedicinus badii]|nr:hypothetical protein AOQ89_00280 [bacterium endosymbiont of Pedicinus badii]